MADLFDVLAARALGTASTLVPAPVPRFAAPLRAQLYDGPALVRSDGPTLGRAPGPPRPSEPARTPADDPALSLSRGPDGPREVARTVLPLATGPHQGTFDLDREAEQPRGTRLPRPGGSGPEAAVAEGDDPSAPRAPRRGPGEGEASSPGLPTADPGTGRFRTAVARGRSGNPVTDSRPRTPYDRDDRTDPAPAAPAPPPPQVTVTIGSVEVRAPAKAPEPRTAPRVPRPEPRLSLQDYLRRDGRR